MLTKFELLLINQTSAQIKLTEAWKASRDTNYLIKMKNTREKMVKEVHIKTSENNSMERYVRRRNDDPSREEFCQRCRKTLEPSPRKDNRGSINWDSKGKKIGKTARPSQSNIKIR